MLKRILGTIWRSAPPPVRRMFSSFAHQRFSATAGGVICDPDGRVLLLKHVFRPGSGWGIPGGFIKSGEPPESALRRELREEVGMEIDHLELAFVRLLTH